MTHPLNATSDTTSRLLGTPLDGRLFSDSEIAAAVAGSTDASPMPELARGIPRVKRPIRDQFELIPTCLDDLIPADHEVRAVWGFVVSQDLSDLYGKIAAVEGGAGRDAVDPRILLTIWLFATIDAQSSARKIDVLCRRDDPYKWICGGVSVNHDLLSRFRAGSSDALDDVLTSSIAVLMSQDLVCLKRVAQDGVRVRASAGKSSFRCEKTLQELHEVAVQHLAQLKLNAGKSETVSARQAAARLHAAADREKRIAKALAALPELAAAREKRKSGDGATTRVSTTDVGARTMKMANGGFNPAYNVQFATDTKSGIIVGVEVTSEGSDSGLIGPMVDQIQERHNKTPEEMLLDGGYASNKDVIEVTKTGVKVYMPVKKEEKKVAKGIDPFAPVAGDAPEVAAWRQRMGIAESKEIYKERASTAEWANAQARNRGLQQFRVRGRAKVANVVMMFAIAHNFVQGFLRSGTSVGIAPS